ncbi:MAG: hypothetical protein VX641_01655 [Planctomycetota bacterium]|nr:hypothetical protein [Planctomycetota bacterium]
MMASGTPLSILVAWSCAAAPAPCQESPFETIGEWIAPEGAAERRFGTCVELGPRWLVIATDHGEDGSFDPGTVRIYDTNDPGSPPVDLLRAPPRRWPDEFGSAIDLEDDRLLIGAPGDSEVEWDRGAAWIFEFRDSWERIGGLVPSSTSAGDRFGDSVALAGEWAAVGAPRSDRAGMDAGAVHLFQSIDEQWIETQIIVAPDAAVADFFGDCVAISGEWMAVGAWGDDDHGEKTGAVWIFHLEGGRWRSVQKIVPADSEARDLFGWTVGLSAGWMLIGSSGWNSNQGAVYAYRLEDRVWRRRQRLRAREATTDEWMGHALSVRKDLLAAGAPGCREGDRIEGAIDLFRLREGRWIWIQRVRAEGATWRQPNQFGWSVSTDGRRILVGRIDDADGPGEAGRAWMVESRACGVEAIRAAGGAIRAGDR